MSERQPEQTFLSAVDEQEIDLSHLLSAIWKQKWKIIAVTFAGACLSIYYALSLPNIYQSEALMMPNSQDSQQGAISGLAGQFGGLASLAGINLGSGGSDKTTYTLELLKSRGFVYDFINENNLKPILFAAKSWNRDNNIVTYNEEIYDHKQDKWVREVPSHKSPEPSDFEVYKSFISNNLNISLEKGTGMVTMSISHISPYVARDILIKLIKSINDTVKHQDISEAKKSIAYLERELKITSFTGMKTMFYKLIEQQQQTLMLAKIRDDYVLKVVDKPVVAENKAKPSRALIVILGTAMSFLLTMFLVLLSVMRTKKGD